MSEHHSFYTKFWSSTHCICRYSFVPETQLPRLLIHQKDISMMSGPTLRYWWNVIGKYITTAKVHPRYIPNDPVLKKAFFRIVSCRVIWVKHNQREQWSVIVRPPIKPLWLALDLCRGQFASKTNGTTCIIYLCYFCGGCAEDIWDEPSVSKYAIEIASLKKYNSLLSLIAEIAPSIKNFLYSNVI